MYLHFTDLTLVILLQDQNSTQEAAELDVFLPQDGSNLKDGIHSGK